MLMSYSGMPILTPRALPRTVTTIAHAGHEASEFAKAFRCASPLCPQTDFTHVLNAKLAAGTFISCHPQKREMCLTSDRQMRLIHFKTCFECA